MKTTSHVPVGQNHTRQGQPVAGQPSARVRWIDYDAVHQCLIGSPEIQGKLSGLLRPIVRRDGKVCYFPEEECRVAEEMHKRGFSAHQSGRPKIMEVALEVLDVGQGYHATRRGIAEIVVSFRLPKRDAHGLGDWLASTPIVGVKSVNLLARKLVMDFKSGKLIYRDLADRAVDWWGLKLERPDTFAEPLAPSGTQTSLQGPSLVEAAPANQLVPTPVREVQCHFVAEAEVSSSAYANKSQPWVTADDLAGDIERMIGILVSRYVDDSNPLLHLDELKAECRAKLAQILDAGHLNKCPTRAKAFGFIKTSLRNHIRSLIQKHVFTEKRTGVKAPPKSQRNYQRNGEGQTQAAVVLRLDDDEVLFQVGNLDPCFLKMEFLEELDKVLTVDERKALARWINYRGAGSNGDADPWLDTRFRDLLRSIRSKARRVLAPASNGGQVAHVAKH